MKVLMTIMISMMLISSGFGQTNPISLGIVQDFKIIEYTDIFGDCNALVQTTIGRLMINWNSRIDPELCVGDTLFEYNFHDNFDETRDMSDTTTEYCAR